jgi:hypothetical protein
LRERERPSHSTHGDRDPCRRDSRGYCVPELPTAEEWQALVNAIDGIQERNEHCAGAKRALQQLAATGRGVNLKVWSGFDLTAGEQLYGANCFFPNGERFIQFDRYHALRELAIIVHEGLHAHFASLAPPDGLVKSSEDYAIAWQETCGYQFSAEWKASGR